MILFNWGVFIWAVEMNRILEVSLGYYINPMLSVLLGVAVLGETMNRLEKWSVFLALS